ncbi:type I 3-dehydroquinate dehydratase [Halocalculus aciditolerans]|uniref:3-dehydroquinate dehydratase n=1 Tax=Halocalculus aciditolerans TaxID=1383812 RepID=A0A830FQX8_9EURY|nr:type I 3-dehydroquinate dehydratase [Halocalculus aciditolerans]GGL72604.1 3-dehydroquinase [Halocalculus aciditolerans]
MTLDFDEFTLCASTADLDVEPAARDAGADAIEFRFDLAVDPLAALDAYDGDLPILATNRVDWEGGDAADDAARLDALETAVEHDAVGAVDVELNALLDGDTAADHDAARVVDAARGNHASVVVSYHDFDRTPFRQDMRGFLGNALEHGDVGKLAVTAEDHTDAVDLLTVTHEYDLEGKSVATMAMGEAGRHTRAVAPVYGSKIGYAPVDPADATAAGQYDVATLRRLVDDLR